MSRRTVEYTLATPGLDAEGQVTEVPLGVGLKDTHEYRVPGQFDESFGAEHMLVNIVSTSASVTGKVRQNSRRPAIHPSGTSAIIPPTRVTLVVRRAPVQASWRL